MPTPRWLSPTCRPARATRPGVYRSKSRGLLACILACNLHAGCQPRTHRRWAYTRAGPYFSRHAAYSAASAPRLPTTETPTTDWRPTDPSGGCGAGIKRADCREAGVMPAPHHG